MRAIRIIMLVCGVPGISQFGLSEMLTGISPSQKTTDFIPSLKKENTWLLPQGGESIFFRKEISVLSIKPL
ncbi:hypothetical protein ACFL23_00555 [Patescibacteria group bacterium]